MVQDLDQFAISKILGYKIKRARRAGFGGFASAPTSQEIQQATREESPCTEPPSSARAEGAIPEAQSLEDIRGDASNGTSMAGNRAPASRTRAEIVGLIV